jgi:hypothetical protein
MKTVMFGFGLLCSVLLLGDQALAQTSRERGMRECDATHSGQVDRQRCYEGYGSGAPGGASPAPSELDRRSGSARSQRERAYDECAARYSRGSAGRERCFDEVDRTYRRR